MNLSNKKKNMFLECATEDELIGMLKKESYTEDYIKLIRSELLTRLVKKLRKPKQN